MTKQNVSIIDYGCGNILSVQRALEHCGAEVSVITQAAEIEQANRVLLPGVGAFENAMQRLNNLRLIEPIYSFVEQQRPFLGVCLGMQLLFEFSEEFGRHQGLSLIPGEVTAIPKKGSEGRLHKIPHIGWNALYPANNDDDWENSILKDIPIGSSAYFVHSFHAHVAQKSHQLAFCLYNGISITAAVQHENIIGCQFHPEKSGTVGLAILKNFLSL